MNNPDMMRAEKALAQYDEDHHPDTLDGELRAQEVADALRGLLNLCRRDKLEDEVKTENYDQAMINVYEVAYVGGTGTLDEVADHFIRAVEAYNAKHGTELIFELKTSNPLEEETK